MSAAIIVGGAAFIAAFLWREALIGRTDQRLGRYHIAFVVLLLVVIAIQLVAIRVGAAT